MKAVVKLVQINRTAPGKCKANLSQEPKSTAGIICYSSTEINNFKPLFLHWGKLSIGMTQCGIWKIFICVPFRQDKVCYLHIFSESVAELKSVGLVEIIES